MKRKYFLSYQSILVLILLSPFLRVMADDSTRVLNFHGSKGFEHESKGESVLMIESICKQNNWAVTSTGDPSVFTKENLSQFKLIVFNNNCGNEGRIFSDQQQLAFQAYIRSGGGFVAIHCAGAIWHEGGIFQSWYEDLVGARLLEHPPVQYANCVIEDRSHPATKHLPELWRVKDEFHTMRPNPRSKVNVLLSVDEGSYQGKEKMNGDHPLVWYHSFEGGRAFFSSLGHTSEMYSNPDYVKMIGGGMRWALGTLRAQNSHRIIRNGLVVDLDADKGVVTDTDGKVEKWTNQVHSFSVKEFAKTDEGRTEKGSGKPSLLKRVSALNNHASISFQKQELVSSNEDALDHLIRGSGYTWACVLKPGKQSGELPDVNSFFGTLKNGGYYEGFWAGLTDNNNIWIGSRNGKSFGRWDANNPYVAGNKILDQDRYYLIMGRMEAGTDAAAISLFVNDGAHPLATGVFPVNALANASKLVIGQERDAVEHPGRESFVGEIARFLLYEKPLNYGELEILANDLMKTYNIKKTKQ